MQVITPQAAKAERRNRKERLTEEKIKKKKCHYAMPLWTPQDEED